jgi:hypothetical protein
MQRVAARRKIGASKLGITLRNETHPEYFSRLRRAEIWIHHHIAGAYLLRSTQDL